MEDAGASVGGQGETGRQQNPEWWEQLRLLGPFPEDCVLINLEIPEPLVPLLGGSVRRASALVVDYGPRVLDVAEDLDGELVNGVWSQGPIVRGGRLLDFLTPSEALVATWADRTEEERLWDEVSRDGVFPHRDWSEMLGVLALVYAAEAVYAWQQAGAEANEIESVPTEVAKKAVGAMEAAAAAERIELEERLEGRAAANWRQIARDAGRAGGKAKHEPASRLRAYLMERYAAHYRNRSNRQAAQQLYKEHWDVVDRVLSTDDPELRIQKWIAQYRRQHPAD